MQRLVKLLNKGVDSNLLSAMVKEAREESAVIEQHHSVPSAPLKESHRDESYDPSKATEEQEYSGQDYLLPHEVALEDGSGFSRIVGMKPGLYVEEQFLRTNKVEEEEHYLYGDSVAEDEHRVPYSQGPGRYKHSVPQEQSREETMPRLRQHKEAASEAAGKQEGIDQSLVIDLQSYLKTVGLELNSSEISQLTHRTNERLYGAKTATASSESKKRNPSPSRRRSRTHSSDSSDSFQSVPPEMPPKRQVFMSFRDQPQHGAKHDSHQGKKKKSLSLRNLTRTIRNTPESTKVDSPESTNYAAESSSSSTLPPDSSQFTYQPPTVPDYAYPDETPYAGPPYAEPSYTPPAFVVDHSGMPTPPPSAYNPYALAAGQAYPFQTYHPPPVISPTGLPGPGLAPPSMPSSSSYYSLDFLPTNPSSSHSYMSLQLPGSTSFPIQQSQHIQKTRAAVKTRCLTVIQPTNVVEASVEMSETTDNTILVQPKQVTTLPKDEITAKRNKRVGNHSLYSS